MFFGGKRYFHGQLLPLVEDSKPPVTRKKGDTKKKIDKKSIDIKKLKKQFGDDIILMLLLKLLGDNTGKEKKEPKKDKKPPKMKRAGVGRGRGGGVFQTKTQLTQQRAAAEKTARLSLMGKQKDDETNEDYLKRILKEVLVVDNPSLSLFVDNIVPKGQGDSMPQVAPAFKDTIGQLVQYQDVLTRGFFQGKRLNKKKRKQVEASVLLALAQTAGEVREKFLVTSKDRNIQQGKEKASAVLRHYYGDEVDIPDTAGFKVKVDSVTGSVYTEDVAQPKRRRGRPRKSESSATTTLSESDKAKAQKAADTINRANEELESIDEGSETTRTSQRVEFWEEVDDERYLELRDRARKNYIVNYVKRLPKGLPDSDEKLNRYKKIYNFQYTKDGKVFSDRIIATDTEVLEEYKRQGKQSRRGYKIQEIPEFGEAAKDVDIESGITTPVVIDERIREEIAKKGGTPYFRSSRVGFGGVGDKRGIEKMRSKEAQNTAEFDAKLGADVGQTETPLFKQDLQKSIELARELQELSGVTAYDLFGTETTATGTTTSTGAGTALPITPSPRVDTEERDMFRQEAETIFGLSPQQKEDYITVRVYGAKLYKKLGLQPTAEGLGFLRDIAVGIAGNPLEYIKDLMRDFVDDNKTVADVFVKEEVETPRSPVTGTETETTATGTGTTTTATEPRRRGPKSKAKESIISELKAKVLSIEEIATPEQLDVLNKIIDTEVAAGKGQAGIARKIDGRIAKITSGIQLTELKETGGERFKTRVGEGEVVKPVQGSTTKFRVDIGDGLQEFDIVEEIPAVGRLIGSLANKTKAEQKVIAKQIKEITQDYTYQLRKQALGEEVEEKQGYADEDVESADATFLKTPLGNRNFIEKGLDVADEYKHGGVAGLDKDEEVVGYGPKGFKVVNNSNAVVRYIPAIPLTGADKIKFEAAEKERLAQEEEGTTTTEESKPKSGAEGSGTSSDDAPSDPPAGAGITGEAKTEATPQPEPEPTPQPTSPTPSELERIQLEEQEFLEGEGLWSQDEPYTEQQLLNLRKGGGRGAYTYSSASSDPHSHTSDKTLSTEVASSVERRLQDHLVKKSLGYGIKGLHAAKEYRKKYGDVATEGSEAEKDLIRSGFYSDLSGSLPEDLEGAEEAGLLLEPKSPVVDKEERLQQLQRDLDDILLEGRRENVKVYAEQLAELEEGYEDMTKTAKKQLIVKLKKQYREDILRRKDLAEAEIFKLSLPEEKDDPDEEREEARRKQLEAERRRVAEGLPSGRQEFGEPARTSIPVLEQTLLEEALEEDISITESIEPPKSEPPEKLKKIEEEEELDEPIDSPRLSPIPKAPASEPPETFGSTSYTTDITAGGTRRRVRRIKGKKTKAQKENQLIDDYLQQPELLSEELRETAKDLLLARDIGAKVRFQEELEKRALTPEQLRALRQRNRQLSRDDKVSDYLERRFGGGNLLAPEEYFDALDVIEGTKPVPETPAEKQEREAREKLRGITDAEARRVGRIRRKLQKSGKFSDKEISRMLIEGFAGEQPEIVGTLPSGEQVPQPKVLLQEQLERGSQEGTESFEEREAELFRAKAIQAQLATGQKVGTTKEISARQKIKKTQQSYERKIAKLQDIEPPAPDSAEDMERYRQELAESRVAISRLEKEKKRVVDEMRKAQSDILLELEANSSGYDSKFPSESSYERRHRKKPKRLGTIDIQKEAKQISDRSMASFERKLQRGEKDESDRPQALIRASQKAERYIAEQEQYFGFRKPLVADIGVSSIRIPTRETSVSQQLGNHADGVEPDWVVKNRELERTEAGREQLKLQRLQRKIGAKPAVKQTGTLEEAIKLATKEADFPKPRKERATKPAFTLKVGGKTYKGSAPQDVVETVSEEPVSSVGTDELLQAELDAFQKEGDESEGEKQEDTGGLEEAIGEALDTSDEPDLSGELDPEFE